MFLIFLRFVSIKYSLFGLLFLLSAFFLSIISITQFSFLRLGIVSILGVLGFFSARFSGMILNQIIDFSYDKKNPRTTSRTLNLGLISKKVALILATSFLLLFFTIGYFLGMFCFILSLIGGGLLLTYSYIKRFHWSAHFFLGAIYLVAILMCFSAFSINNFYQAFSYGLAVLFFISGNDIVYSIQDKDFDKKENLYSVPSVFSNKITLRIVLVCYLLGQLCFSILYFDYVFFILNLLMLLGMLVMFFHLKKELKEKKTQGFCDKYLFFSNMFFSICCLFSIVSHKFLV